MAALLVANDDQVYSQWKSNLSPAEPRCFMMLASYLYVDSYVTVDVQISDGEGQILQCYITSAAGVACKDKQALCRASVSFF